MWPAFFLFLLTLAGCGEAPPPPPMSPHTPEPEPILRCDSRTEERKGFLDVRFRDRQAAFEHVLTQCVPSDVVGILTDIVAFQTVASYPAPDRPPVDGEPSTLTPAEVPGFVAFADYLRAFANTHELEFTISGPHDAYLLTMPGTERVPGTLFVTHGDVVPINDPPAPVEPAFTPSGWSSPPFRAELRDGFVHGRGTEDDKGPIAAVLTVFRAMHEANLRPAKDVALAIGTAEEHDWDGMRRFADTAPRFEHVISVDSSFPVVVAESGFVRWGLKVAAQRSRRASDPRRGGTRVVELSGGLFLTQVPGSARLVLDGLSEGSLAQLRSVAEEHVRTLGGDPYRYSLTQDGSRTVLEVFGRPSHSTEADEHGRNALFLLSAIASAYPLPSGAPKTMLEIIEKYFAHGHYGQALQIGYEDELMGKLLVTPDVLRMQEDGSVTLDINMRRPRGMSKEEFGRKLDAALARLRREFGSAVREDGERYIGEPHIADSDGALVQQLLLVYRDVFGDPGPNPIRSIRGGTYARLFPGAVDFGPSLPGEAYTGHGDNERIAIDTLVKCARAYARIATW